MGIISVYVILAIALFGAAFFAKRRFGLLGLALASGSLLSGIWGYDAGLITSALGIPNNQLVSALTAAIIVLLPAGVLLFHGYTYKTIIGRFVGASLFTVLALAFLIQPLSTVLMPAGVGIEAYSWLSRSRDLVIGAGLVISVVDLFLTKPVGSKKRR